MAAKKKTTTEAAENAIRHPRETLDLRGQEQAESQLMQALTSGKLHHAWLITGGKGIGKATLAHRFARYLLAAGGRDESAMRRIINGSHTDLLTLEASAGSDISVDDARKVNEFLALTPAEGSWRVVIIDSIDAMNRQAANAILKTLEEPPPQAILLLVCHNPGAILPTIRSRCRVLKLRPLPKEDFTAIVQEHQPVGDYEHYYQLADGSAGIALFLMEQEALALYHAFLELFTGKSPPDHLKLHAIAEQLAARQDWTRFEAFHHILGYFFRQLIRVHTGEPIHELLEGEQSVLAYLASRHSVEGWFSLWQEITILLNDTKRIHLDRKQVLLNIVAKIHPNR